MSQRLPRALWSRPIAHRGLHDGTAAAPENSVAAVRAAAAAGYGVEIDVRPSGDGAPMVAHDADLRRVAGAPERLLDRTAAALTETTLFGGAETMPTLEAALAAAGDTPVFVEVKHEAVYETRTVRLSDDWTEPLDAWLRAEVVDAWTDRAATTALMSADRGARRALAAETRPEVCGAVVGDPAALAAATADALRLGFLACAAPLLSDPALQQARALGLPVIAWTIRSAAEAAAARPFCDQIIFEAFRPDPADWRP